MYLIKTRCFAAILLIGMIFNGLCITNIVLAADNTTIDNSSKQLEYLIPMFCYKGRPENNNSVQNITVFVNHGYVAGYSTKRNQPLWVSYRVSRIKNSKYTNLERSPFFYPDLRLPEGKRISGDTFGKGFDRGHMAPNQAITKVYGGLAQLETYLMTNICPQRSGLNQGPWMRLEDRIANQYVQARDHLWVLTGPVFQDDLGQIRGVDIPSHFYMIVVDVKGWPGFKPEIMAFKFPQSTSKKEKLSKKYLVSVKELETLTGLNFFPEFRSQEVINYESRAAGGIWPLN